MGLWSYLLRHLASAVFSFTPRGIEYAFPEHSVYQPEDHPGDPESKNAASLRGSDLSKRRTGLPSRTR